MERRSGKRIKASIDARFFYGNLFYSGTVLDLSEKGMYINTRRCLPFESMFIILIQLENGILKVIARVKRNVMTDSNCGGLGVELLSPSEDYQHFIKGLKKIQPET